MKILLAPQVTKRLRRELRRAGSREIGGLLMGEDLGEGLFRVVEISVQHSGGTHVCFIRNPKDHQAELDAFFARTGNDYRRFNYLGEWHSHPSFDSFPSGTDIETMQSIVSDAAVGANFLALIITRLSGKQLEATATVFMPSTEPFCVPLAAEQDKENQEGTAISKWLRKLFRT